MGHTSLLSGSICPGFCMEKSRELFSAKVDAEIKSIACGTDAAMYRSELYVGDFTLMYSFDTARHNVKRAVHVSYEQSALHSWSY